MSRGRDKAEHTEQLGTTTLKIVFAKFVHMRRITQTETVAIMRSTAIFFITALGIVRRRGRGFRGIYP